VGRTVALSTVLEQLSAGTSTYDLATNEFEGAFSPRGFTHLSEFRNDVAATFVFRVGGVELSKEIALADSGNAVAIRYTLRGGDAELRIRPFAAMRDYHLLRLPADAKQLTLEIVPGGLAVRDGSRNGHVLHVLSRESKFQPDPQWWRRFHYRAEVARGQEGFEDLYSPGWFVFGLRDGQSCQLTASLGEPAAVDFSAAVERRRRRLEELASSVAGDEDETASRLAIASDAFLAARSLPDGKTSLTIIAGFHWFADWGRDAFIALPGLLLSTGRLAAAREVFETFASRIENGMVPNCFDDYSSRAHYNSIDASLWFIIACERYLAAGGDASFWRDTLMPACHTILTRFRTGTLFDIRAEADGLLAGGSRSTQLTWMDAKLGDEAVTPRHGKAVEVNALWHSAHRIMARRCRGIDSALAGSYEHAAETIATAFGKAFWNDQQQCLYDCRTDAGPDASIRPNQVFAVSLPYSPLLPQQQVAVLRIVEAKLLTPMGLRTLSPDDPRYRGRYGVSWQSRDRAYHQGTVWAWLIGPFVEAYLKLEGSAPAAVEKCSKMLSAFDDHLRRAGLGFVSEIFDGDPPHAARGCIAQAWSVGEVLRAKRLVAECARKIRKGPQG
jgi:predicted glycogen debranching enzyme